MLIIYEIHSLQTLRRNYTFLRVAIFNSFTNINSWSQWLAIRGWTQVQLEIIFRFIREKFKTTAET